MDYINLIDGYYINIKNDKDKAISYWYKLKKMKIRKRYLGLNYLIKYIVMDSKESLRLLLHNLKIYFNYLMISIKFKKIKIKKYLILDDIKTVDKVVNDGYSIARYGDGEFKWIFGIKQNSFQKDSAELSQRLKEIIENYDNNSNLLIGINDAMNSMNEYTIDAKLYWKKYLLELSDKLYKLLPNSTYCCTNLTRPYIDYKNKDKKIMEQKFTNLKRIWNNRDIVIVEGKFTKLGIGNDLFNNCKSIKRIICPPINAFEKYNEIKKKVRLQSKDKLILISLGPTATILSYDMSKEGYQCIDTGHIDIEYMWFLNGAEKKEEVVGKFVNEVSKDVTLLKDDDYESQIIASID